MFYYGSKKDEDKKSTYILSVDRDEENESYSITFANGDVFENVPICPENTEIIEERLMSQAAEAVDNNYKLSHKCKTGKILGFIGGPVLAGVTGALTYQFTGDPTLTSIPITLFSLGGILTGIRTSQRLTPMIEEANNLEQRILQQKDMGTFLNESPNAYRYLNGETMDEKTERMDLVQGMKKEGRDPFGLIEIDGDGISHDEFNRLVKGAKREAELGFVYHK